MKEYEKRYPKLVRVAANLEEMLKKYCEAVPHVDRITVRAKAPERFATKASKADEMGNLKYAAPLDQIQDQIGARIIVIYLADVGSVRNVVEKYFRSVEARELVPEDHWAFGYFGHHWVFPLPEDLIPEGDDVEAYPRFFELQVKTLFQHAWSEANHDLGYKSRHRLTPIQKRQFAYTAAQAWGADRVFEEFREAIVTATDAGGAETHSEG